MFNAGFASFTVSIASASILDSTIVGPVARNHQEPSLEQGGLGRPQCMLSGPRLPAVLQKARTAHLASKLTLFTSGFLYSFFVFFIIIRFFLDPGSRPPPADLAGMTSLDGHGGPSHQHRGPPYWILATDYWIL